jgi:hypothetical protein
MGGLEQDIQRRANASEIAQPNKLPSIEGGARAMGAAWRVRRRHYWQQASPQACQPEAAAALGAAAYLC